MATPRLFLARHGETAWSLTGQHTGVTDLHLTAHGESQVAASRLSFVGPSRLIDPARLSHIYVSPRARARQTLQLLLPGGADRAVVDERVREWGYGRYEGMMVDEIRLDRHARGLDVDRKFDIWRDGCEDSVDGIGIGLGESTQQMTERIDEVVAEVKGIHEEGIKEGRGDVDILIVSHGHYLRAFTKRWLGFGLDFPLSMILEPGGIATLTYAHHNIDEPAFLLGGVFRAGEEEAGGEQVD